MSRVGATWSRVRLLAMAAAVIFLIVIAVYLKRDAISAGLAAQQATKAMPSQQTAQPVRVSQVAFGSPDAHMRFTGTVRPRHEADLGFRVSGKLMERLVSVGDQVTAGQVIARLDPADARLDLESTEAERTAAEAELGRAEAAEARSRRLLAAGHVSQAAHDRVVATAAEAQGRAERALRARDLAANRLNYMVLRATGGGVVTRELAEAGQVVAAGQAVVSVARMDQLDVVFALPEQKRDLVEQAEAAARLWDKDAASYALLLRDVSPDVDPATRTYRVRMALLHPDRHVTLGRTVAITFTVPAGEPVAALALGAVLNDGKGAAVWRLMPDRQRVERVPVEIAALDSNHAIVRGGLRDGDLVVSLGAHKLDPARPVRVVETTASTLD
jgi:RND family efflux transporter MFP subunit